MGASSAVLPPQNHRFRPSAIVIYSRGIMEVMEGLVGYGSIGAVGMVVEDLQPGTKHTMSMMRCLMPLGMMPNLPNDFGSRADKPHPLM